MRRGQKDACEDTDRYVSAPTHTHTPIKCHISPFLVLPHHHRLCVRPPPLFFLCLRIRRNVSVCLYLQSSALRVCVCVRAHPHTHARTHRRRLPCAAVMALSCQNIPAFTHYLPPKQPGSVCLCAGSQGRLSTFSSLSFISLPTLSPSFSSFVIFSPPPFPQYFSLSSLFFHFCLILSFCFSHLLNVFLPFFRFLLVERRV